MNLERWPAGPEHNSVPPVVVTFKEPSDRNEIYNVCREGMEKTNLVITEDSRSVKSKTVFSGGFYPRKTLV